MEPKICDKRLMLSHWELKTKEAVADVLSNAKQYESIEVHHLDFENVKKIVQICGSEAKAFEWGPNESKKEECRESPWNTSNFILVTIVRASNLIELLSLMPKLESFTLYIQQYYYQVEFCEVEGIEFNLKALHIKTRDAQNLAQAYELFNQILRQDSIVEHSSTFLYQTDRSDQEVVAESAREFFNRQKLIKSLETAFTTTLGFVKDHELELLKYKKWKQSDYPEVAEVLRTQKKLKVFKFWGYDCKSFIDELCKLSELDTLILKLWYASFDCTKLKKLQNLKELKFLVTYGDVSNFYTEYLNQVRPNLIKLELDGRKFKRSCEWLANLPNLAHLTITCSQKLNTFAKFLPKLEELKLHTRNFNFCELDTGIVNKNLKKLDLTFETSHFSDFISGILEIFEIYPNLEDLKLVAHKGRCSKDLIDEKFFERLSEVERLKILDLFEVSLKSEMKHFPKIAEDLIKLSRKLKFVKIHFYEFLLARIEIPNYSLLPIAEMLQNDFKILKSTPTILTIKNK